MKIFALIPNMCLRKARKKNESSFLAHCTLAEDSSGEMTMIITVQNEFGYALNGTQFVGDLEMSQDAATREGAVETKRADDESVPSR